LWAFLANMSAEERQYELTPRTSANMLYVTSNEGVAPFHTRSEAPLYCASRHRQAQGSEGRLRVPVLVDVSFSIPALVEELMMFIFIFALSW